MRKSVRNNGNSFPSHAKAAYSVLVKMAKAEQTAAVNSSKLAGIAARKTNKPPKPAVR